MTAPVLHLVGPDPDEPTVDQELEELRRRLDMLELQNDAVFAYLADSRTRPTHPRTRRRILAAVYKETEPWS